MNMGEDSVEFLKRMNSIMATVSDRGFRMMPHQVIGLKT